MDPVIIHFGNAKYKRLVKVILEVWEKKGGQVSWCNSCWELGLTTKLVVYSKSLDLCKCHLFWWWAITDDATLTETFIFLRKKQQQQQQQCKNQTRLLSQVLPLTWFSKPKCVCATCPGSECVSEAKTTASLGLWQGRLPHQQLPAPVPRGEAPKPWEGQIPSQGTREAGGSHSRQSSSERNLVKGAWATWPLMSTQRRPHHSHPGRHQQHMPTETAHTQHLSYAGFHSCLPHGLWYSVPTGWQEEERRRKVEGGEKMGREQQGEGQKGNFKTADASSLHSLLPLQQRRSQTLTGKQ